MTTVTENYDFYISGTDADTYIAARSASPYFCFEGATEEEVAEKAGRALAFYCANKHALSTTEIKTVTQRVQLTRVFKRRRREHYKAEDCVAA